MKKICKGLYSHRGFYLVRLPNDKDWGALRSINEAENVLHGNSPETVFYIHNTLQDLRRFIDQEEE